MSDFSDDLTRFLNEKYPSKDRFSLDTKMIAEKLNVTEGYIRKIKHDYKERFQEGIHFHVTSSNTNKGIRHKTMWFIEGINELTDVIRTDEAREHRELTTIDPNRLLQRITSLIKEELESIPQLVEDVKQLKNEMVHPITFSKLLRQFSDKRYEVKTKLDINWQKIHDTAKNWTQKSKYEHMSPEEMREGMRRLNELLDSYNKK